MYCEVSAVQALVKNVDFASANSIVPSDTIEEWIKEESGYIDSVISKRYQTPVDIKTATKAKIVLQKICSQLVLKKVAPLLGQSVSGNSDEKNLYSTFNPYRLLMDIADFKSDLEDAMPLEDNTPYGVEYNLPPKQFNDRNDQW